MVKSGLSSEYGSKIWSWHVEGCGNCMTLFGEDWGVIGRAGQAQAYALELAKLRCRVWMLFGWSRVSMYRSRAAYWSSPKVIQ